MLPKHIRTGSIHNVDFKDIEALCRSESYVLKQKEDNDAANVQKVTYN